MGKERERERESQTDRQADRDRQTGSKQNDLQTEAKKKECDRHRSR